MRGNLEKVDDCRKADRRRPTRPSGASTSLVNSAGVTDRGTIWDTSPELFDLIFSVNVRAPFFLMQEAAKVMRREKAAGTMVNIISMSGHGGQTFITAYCASKGALITLTRNVAFSLMRHRIRVNGLTIGWMDTPGGGPHHEDLSRRRGRLAQRRPKPSARGDACSSPTRWRARSPTCRPTSSGLMTGSIIDFDQQVRLRGSSAVTTGLERLRIWARVGAHFAGAYGEALSSAA